MLGRRLTYLACFAGCLIFYLAYGEWLSWVALLLALGLPWLSLALSLPAMLTLRLEIETPGALP